MPEMKDRAMPYDFSAEGAVLSAMMIDPLSVIKSINEIKPEYFFKKEHKVIFEAMRQLFSEQSEVDPITLISCLESNKNLEKAGGRENILELADIVVSGANFSYHVKILYHKYLLRELIMTSNKIIEKCYESSMPADELLDFAEQAVYQLSETSKREGFVKASDHINEVLQTIEDIMSKLTNVHGVATGFIDVDKVLGGLRPGQFIVLAARPGIGKSAFVINIASNTALKEGSKVAIFTMEMSSEEVLMRMISIGSGVPLDNLLKGYGMNESKISKVFQAAEAINTLDIYLDDTGTNTALDLRAKARRLKAEANGLDLIIVDYLQLMSSARKSNENRQQEIAEISRSLKILSKELNVPVIGLSQLNRAPANRDDQRPRLSDLRESGAIEQDADVVLFLYRDPKNREDLKRENIVNISIAKNRQGRTCEEELNFFPEFTRFADLEKD